MSSEDDYCSSEEEGPRGSLFVHDPEEWQDYHSEFLVTAWHSLKDHIASMGVYVLDACTFADFAQFCYERSTRRKPPC